VAVILKIIRSVRLKLGAKAVSTAMMVDKNPKVPCPFRGALWSMSEIKAAEAGLPLPLICFCRYFLAIYFQ